MPDHFCRLPNHFRRSRNHFCRSRNHFCRLQNHFCGLRNPFSKSGMKSGHLVLWEVGKVSRNFINHPVLRTPLRRRGMKESRFLWSGFFILSLGKNTPKSGFVISDLICYFTTSLNFLKNSRCRGFFIYRILPLRISELNLYFTTSFNFLKKASSRSAMRSMDWDREL